jgi:hypothetical protein
MNTYTEAEIAAIIKRFEFCKDYQCMESVLKDAAVGNGGELPECLKTYETIYLRARYDTNS